MGTEKPIEWVINARARGDFDPQVVQALIPSDVPWRARRFHRQLPGYRMSPLVGLPNLAARLGLGGIWVKDESQRLNLRSFKVLGGSYAIYQWVRQRLGITDRELSFTELTSGALRERLGEITFAAATDGNHGRGVAWSAAQMGFKAVIYVHKLTSQQRIQAIEQTGAKVVVIDGTYDDAVHQVNEDAQRYGWVVISDTAWEGYEDIPKWVMQGYTTMLSEAQEQLAAQGLSKPTHVFVQAGVGSLAAATLGYYANLFGAERPLSVVVEPTKAACLYLSAKIGDGQPHKFEGELDTIMAGLACGEPNPLAWQVLQHIADVFAMCPDYVAAKGMRVYGVPLRGDPMIISGESGAVTLGALLFIMEYPGARELREFLGLGPDSQVLLINSEGNTSPDDFRYVMWEGGNPVPDEYKIFRSSVPGG
ncbi:diaminopropionate ammonia-lyase [uncultured Thermanaerothrix sp.]|uniref:diaminopropionate ammonia-lyase n=1 Tax=uncultured Thermanaerothrix sp. TaxID=1195149 RepID=UPI00260F432D|nr:diaminopropionate ammonia-lyase [uncultured Thermanaerothrix sp.]